MGSIQSILGMAKPSDSRNDIIKKRTDFYDSYHRHQSFALPNSIIYYISKNPSTPNQYQKMVKTCKYFFAKNPIIIISCFYSYVDERFKSTEIDSIELDLKKISSKLWITERIGSTVDYENFNGKEFFSTIIPKIYQCDIRCLSLDTDILFKDFIFLASKCEEIWLTLATVFNEDGTIVSLEKIVEAVPKIQNFDYWIPSSSNIVTSETVHDLLKIPHFFNLDSFILRDIPDIPDIFDIDTFYSYIKENKKTKIELYFDDSISENYQIRLQNIVNEILQTKKHNYKIPIIHFPEIDFNTYEKLIALSRYRTTLLTESNIAHAYNITRELFLYSVAHMIAYCILKFFNILRS